MPTTLDGPAVPAAGSDDGTKGLDRIVASLHVALWWLVASTLHTAPMPTVVEELARAAEGFSGFLGHPPLAGLLLGFFWTAASYTGIAFLAALPAAVSYILLWQLGLRLAGPGLAVAGTLASVALFHFSWATPDFGPAALLTPIWIAVVLAFRAALERPSLWRWLPVGLLAGIGCQASILVLGLIAGMAAWMVIDPAARRLLKTPGPWLAAALAGLGLLPLAIGWLAAPAPAGDALDALASLPGFLGLNLLFIVPVALILLIGGCRFGGPTRPSLFLGTLFAVPVIAALAGAVVLRLPLALASGAPLLCLAGPLLASLATPARRPSWLVGAAFAVLVGVPAAWAVHVQILPRFTGAPPEMRWPQRAIARGVESASRVEAGDAPLVVAGSPWLAGLAALTLQSSDQARTRPKVLFDGDRRLSPYVDERDLAGVVAIVAPATGDLPPSLNDLWRSRGAPGFQRLTFPWPGFPEIAPLQLRVAVLQPVGGGNKLAGR